MNIVMLLRPKSEVAYLNSGNSVRQGLEKMKSKGYAAIPVLTRDGRYVGTVTEGDFLWHIINHESYDIKDHEKYVVDDIIDPRRNPKVKIDTAMDDLIPIVMDSNFVPVVDDRDFFMGIITRRDIIKYFYGKGIWEGEIKL